MYLYEYACRSCDLIMQVQLSKTIDNGMVCICGEVLDKVFRAEIDESVFSGEDNYEENVPLHVVQDDNDNRD